MLRNRKNKYNFNEGDQIGSSGMVFIREVEKKLEPKRGYVRIVELKCFCGKIFQVRILHIISGNTRSCGCLQKKVASILNKKHGMHLHPMYGTWADIKGRTLNANSDCYENYGGRGIIMFPPWKEDFQLFYDYVTALPDYGNKGYTIDRINNDGNYEPGNLRWTTRHVQNSNNRKKPNSTSGYVGVGKTYKRWCAYVGRKRLGSWKTKEEALAARNNYIIANNLTEYKIQEVRQ
jgi:hypothetical protein